MNLRAVIEIVEIVVADAAGVAMMGSWFREFRRARQSPIALVEAGQLMELELQKDSKTDCVFSSEISSPSGGDERGE